MAQRKPKDAGGPGKAKKTSPAPKAEDRRVYFKQSDFPQATLQHAQRIASALVDNFASDSGSAPDVTVSIRTVVIVAAMKQMTR